MHVNQKKNALHCATIVLGLGLGPMYNSFQYILGVRREMIVKGQTKRMVSRRKLVSSVYVYETGGVGGVTEN